MKIPNADKKLEVFFRSILPDNTSVTVRPMFGNISAFINGNMFAGLFGDALFVRLSEDGRSELLFEKGAKVLEPMKGRPMKDYVCVPPDWLGNATKITPWISKSLEWSSKLPAKQKAKKAKKSGK